ncbi:hypothetical protein EV1_007598 [Malus domestica]
MRESKCTDSSKVCEKIWVDSVGVIACLLIERVRLNLERIIRVWLTRVEMIKVLDRLGNYVNWSSYEWLVLLGKVLKFLHPLHVGCVRWFRIFHTFCGFPRSCFLASMLLACFLASMLLACMVLCC